MTDLETQLLEVGGVASVLVEELDGAPVSASLRLVEDADEIAVSIEVKAILAKHGLKTRSDEDHPTSNEAQEVLEGPTLSDPDTVDLTAGPVESGAIDLPEQRQPSVELNSVGPVPMSPARVQSATLGQTPEGLRVTVTLEDGRSGERIVHPGGDQIRMAVVSIVGVLLGVVGVHLAQYKVEEFTGRRAVTVIVERGTQTPGIGTAFESGTVFEPGTVELAIARAAWAAILG
jgi:hypothetical protein